MTEFLATLSGYETALVAAACFAIPIIGAPVMAWLHRNSPKEEDR